MSTQDDGALVSQASGNGTPMLFSESTSDSTQPKNNEDKSPELPAALKSLEAAGMMFEQTDLASWKPHGKSASLTKSMSVTFSVDTIVSSNEIIIAFDKAGVDIDEITSIQRRTSNKTWVVAFSSVEVKQQALHIPFITIAGCEVFIGDAENKLVLVKIYEAPCEMPDTVIIGRLSHYGKVLSFRRDMLSSGISNGIRTARMVLGKPIPSAVFIAGERIFISYPGQPKTCRKCGDEGHLANTCTSVRCFNCEQSGHRATECEEDEVCGICRDSDHTSVCCPYLRYCANVKPSAPGVVSYATIAKTIVSAAKPKPKQRKDPLPPIPEPTLKVNLPKDLKERHDNAKKAAKDAKESGSKESGTARKKDDSERSESGSKDSERDRKKDDSERRDSERDRKKDDSERRGDRERERDRERDRDRERERTRDRSGYQRDRDRDRDREREREREHDRQRDRDYDQYYRERSHRDHRDDSDDERGWTVVSSRRRSGKRDHDR